MESIVKELVAPDGRRKVQIFRRDNGTYGFESFRFDDDPLALCWVPYGRFSKCIADSEELAEHEARGHIDWFRDGNDEGVAALGDDYEP